MVIAQRPGRPSHLQLSPKRLCTTTATVLTKRSASNIQQEYQASPKFSPILPAPPTLLPPHIIQKVSAAGSKPHNNSAYRSLVPNKQKYWASPEFAPPPSPVLLQNDLTIALRSLSNEQGTSLIAFSHATAYTAPWPPPSRLHK